MDHRNNTIGYPEDNSNRQSHVILLTLPISCQICLGKVKDPVVCSNQHVFCGTCLEQWLKKSPFCPACRVPINDSNPSKKLLGSMDEASQEQTNDPVLKSQLRRTRLRMLFDEFHNEIDYLEEKLLKYATENKGLRTENDHLRKQLEDSELKLIKCKQTSGVVYDEDGDPTATFPAADPNSADIKTILKISNKLQEMINVNENITQMNTALRKELKSCRGERDMYFDDIQKLKEEYKFPQSSQKYTVVAALQAKVDSYEIEIQQLKKSLKASDEYIDESKSESNSYKYTASGEINDDNNVEQLRKPTSARNQPSYKSNVNSSASEALKNFVLSSSMRDSLFSEPILTEWDRSTSARSFINRILTDGLRKDSNKQNSTSNLNANNKRPLSSPPDQTRVDLTRFPACAKLIELTKTRSDTANVSTISESVVDKQESHINKSNEDITVVIPSSEQPWLNRDWKFHNVNVSERLNTGSQESTFVGAGGETVDEYEQNRHSSDNFMKTTDGACFSQTSSAQYTNVHGEDILVVNPNTTDICTSFPVKKIKLEDIV